MTSALTSCAARNSGVSPSGAAFTSHLPVSSRTWTVAVLPCPHARHRAALRSFGRVEDAKFLTLSRSSASPAALRASRGPCSCVLGSERWNRSGGSSVPLEWMIAYSPWLVEAARTVLSWSLMSWAKLELQIHATEPHALGYGGLDEASPNLGRPDNYNRTNDAYIRPQGVENRASRPLSRT